MLKRIAHFTTTNWALKLAAAGLALLLWMAVRAGTAQTHTYRNIPVEVDLRDPDWRLVGEPEPAGVSVTVVGTLGDLRTLAGQPPRLLMQVERIADSVETHVLPLQRVLLPRGVGAETRVVAMRPDTVRLRYERVETRTLPVRVRIRGELPEGLTLALPVRANPGAVEVRGPARLVRQLDSVPLLPVDISGLRATTNVPTSVDTAGLTPLRFNPTDVNTVFRIVPVEIVPDVPEDTVGARPGDPS